MIPNPPTWISTRITTCPNSDQYAPVSTVTSPVTHTAEVAVNTASSRVERSPVAVAAGNDSSTEPTAIAPRNDTASTRPGC